MGQGRLAGARGVAAADQAGGADRVVGRAEGRARPAGPRRAPAGAGDPRHLQRLARRQRRQDRGQAARGQRLAGAGRADHQQAVPARRGDLERVAQVRLAAQVGEVGAAAARLEQQRQRLGALRRPLPAASRGAGRCSPARSRRRRRPAPPRARSRPAPRSPPPLPPAPPRRSPAPRRRAGSSRPAPARRPSPAAAAPPSSAAPRRVSSAAAIARSIPGPALRRLAGARLATIRRSGNSKPQLTSAARTRSRASLTAASGRPTIEKLGRPRWTSTSTRTGRAEMPSSVNVLAVASTVGTLRPARDSHVLRKRQDSCRKRSSLLARDRTPARNASALA